ncbi:MAG TPA: glycosyltransferase family 4 protein [Gammaproteobacteria bacterium]|nr:glycosyltransferase family 4 protein [Gammaproteobacteria bacterium]
MTRVLFLCHRYTDVTLGGLAEFLHFLPLALKQYAIESVIYTSLEKKTTKQLYGPHYLANNIPHYAGPLLKPRFFILQGELNPLLELCKKEKIDMIHAQGIYRAGYMAMHVHQQLGIPYILTSHSDILSSHSQRMRQYRIRKRCQKILENAHFITHLSPLMAEASNQLYSTSTKSKIIHNGVDVNAWNDYLNLPESDYLLAIGRLEPEKGFSVLVDSYAQLVKQGIQTSLVIAGIGSIQNELRQQAKAHRLNVVSKTCDWTTMPSQSIVFAGYVKNIVKKILFANAKLVLFATQAKQWTEPFGIVQLEAMAAGKALIASDIPIVHYLQSLGLHAKLVDDTDKMSWSTAITDLLANDTLRYTMGKANREAAKKFAWDSIAKEYAIIYKRLLNSY